jgi:hypothetical protein
VRLAPCGHARRPAEQRLCCCGERRPCVRRGAGGRGRAAGSGEWRRAPGLQVGSALPSVCSSCSASAGETTTVVHLCATRGSRCLARMATGTHWALRIHLTHDCQPGSAATGARRGSGSSTIDGSKPGQPSGVKKDQPVPSLLSAKLQRTGVVQKTHHRRRTRLPLTYHGNSKRAAARLARTSPATSQACRQSWAGRNTATAVF